MSTSNDPPPEGTAAAGVVGRAGLVALFTFLSRILGFVREQVLTHVFGAGPTYDAFVVAQTIPNLLRRLVAEGSLVIAFVPLLSAEKERGGLPAMRRFTAAVLGVLIPFLLVICALGMLFPSFVVELFASGFTGERAALAASMTRTMFPYVFFISLMALAGGALNTVGHFVAPAAAPILLNVAIITLVVAFRDRFAEPIMAAAWGIVAGGVLQLAAQLPFLARADLLVSPRHDPSDPSLRLLLKRMAPAVFGVAAYQFNLIAIRQLGSYLPEGQLSWYNTATRLQEFTLGIFAVSVSVAALPTLSEHAAREDWGALRATLRHALRVTNFITIPATMGLCALSGPIVGVLFRHGRFTAEDAEGTAMLLLIMSLAMVPIGAIRVTAPTFYALGDTRTPVIAALVSLVVTVGGGFALIRWEIDGLTIATSIAAGVQLLVLWWALRRAMAARPAPRVTARDPSVIGHALRCAAAAAPGTIAVYAVSRQWSWMDGRNLEGGVLLTAMIGFAVLVYMALAKVLGIDDAGLILDAVRRRLARLVHRR